MHKQMHKAHRQTHALQTHTAQAFPQTITYRNVDTYPTPYYLADIPQVVINVCQAFMKNSLYCGPGQGQVLCGSPSGHRFRCIENIWREGWRLQGASVQLQWHNGCIHGYGVGHVEMPLAMKQRSTDLLSITRYQDVKKSFWD